MLIDHLGWIFFPQLNILRIIGRLSFPLFAFLVAEGSTKTKNISSYINRLLIFGLISQIPYSYSAFLAGGKYLTLNIFLTLAVGLFLIKLIQENKRLQFAFFFLIFCFANVYISYDYGIYGLLIILFSYLFIKKPILGSVALIATSFLEATNFSGESLKFGNQIFAILALLPILFYKGVAGRKISKWYFYFFYPVHLIVLAVVYVLLK
jgi:hypothetical protein